MIELDLQGNKVRLPPSAKIQIQRHNQVLGDNAMAGEYSLPFSFPISENAAALNHAQYIYIANRIKKYADSKVSLSGKPIDAGNFFLSSTTAKDFSGFITIGLSGFDELLNKKIADLDLGGTRVLGADTDAVIDFANDQVTETWPNVHFNYPMFYNKKFYSDDENPVWLTKGFCNHYDSINATFFKNTADTGNINAMLPWTYLMYIIQQGFADQGYTIEGSFVDHPLMQSIILPSNRDADRFRDLLFVYAEVVNDYTVGPIVSNSLLNFDAGSEIDADNIYTAATNSTLITRAGTYKFSGQIDAHKNDFGSMTIFVASAIPDDIPIGNITGAWGAGGGDISIPFEFTYTFTEAEIAGGRTVEIAETRGVTGLVTILGTSWMQVEYVSQPKLNEFALEIDLADFVQDITFGELINELRKTYNLEFVVDRTFKKVAINFWNDQLVSAPENYDTSRCPVPVSKLVSAPFKSVAPRFKSMGYDFDTTDELVMENFPRPDESSSLYQGVFSRFLDLETSIIAEQASINQFAYVLQTNKYYVVKNFPDQTAELAFQWAPLCDSYFIREINDTGQVNQRIKLAPVFMSIQISTPSNGYFLLPEISQYHASLQKRDSDPKPALRFAYWWGMQECSNGEVYPFASPLPMLYDGSDTTITDFWPIFDTQPESRLAPPPSFYTTYWSPIIQYVQSTDLFTILMNFSFEKWRQFNNRKPFRAFNETWLALDDKADFGKDVGLTAIECYKLNTEFPES